MISVQEATNIIQGHLLTLGIEIVELKEALGRVLAEEVVADRHFPPFDKVAMDGIAIQYSDWATGKRQFHIMGIQYAGEQGSFGDQPGSCIEIMTGAVLPGVYDTVVRYEDVGISADGKWASIAVDQIHKGQNIQPEGKDKKKGEVILPEAMLIGPAEMAVLASVGKARVQVRKLPKVAVIATGDELVAVTETPQLYQLRMSNTWAISAALMQWKVPHQVFHLTDEKALLTTKLDQIFTEYEVVVLSGGVSKGKADHVPEVLEALGVTKHFHRINQKPGKPFWFGIKGSQKFVFAFPGNPVSTFLCLNKYFLPWLRASLGLKNVPMKAELDTDFSFGPKMTYFLQVSLYQHGPKMMAKPVVGMGSGDFANLTLAKAFMELPPEKDFFAKGEVYPIVVYGGS